MKGNESHHKKMTHLKAWNRTAQVNDKRRQKWLSLVRKLVRLGKIYHGEWKYSKEVTLWSLRNL